MKSQITTTASIALSAWASFGFNASARGQLDPSPSSPQLTQPETDRLRSVRIGQELICLGCEGEQVSLVQALLNTHGARPQLTVTGIFDKASDRALRAFQAKHHAADGLPLSVDGVVGPGTLYALEHAGTPLQQQKYNGPLADVLNQVRLYKEGDTGGGVLEIKRLLNNAGARPKLRETAVFDRATTHAVVAFQSRWNNQQQDSDYIRIPIDGLVKRRTALALQEAGQRTMFGEAWSTVQKTIGKQSRGAVPLSNDKTFEQALGMVLKFEGGLSTDPHDRGNRGGNVTMQGVTQASYDEYRVLHQAPLRSVSSITPAETKQLYRELYWLRGRCNRLPENLAIAHFNTCVNMGPRAAAAILQESLGVRIDREIGRKTLQAALQVDPYSATEAYLDIVARRYHSVASVNSNQRYLGPWLRRLNEVRAICGVTGSSLPAMVALSRDIEPADFGISFSEGLRNFQSAKGLPVSGVVDDATEECLHTSH